MRPNKRRSVDNNNTPLTQTPPTRFITQVVDADPGDREDKFEDDDTGDDDKDPE
jgi:hypothetical protein